jgi:uncharacterized protein
MNWSDLLAAFGLYLVVDGMLPFVNPEGMRRLMLTLARLADGQLRLMGLLSMIAGLVLLYLSQAS